MTAFNRLFTTMTKPLFILSYIGLIVFSLLYLDKPIAYYFHRVEFKSSLPLIRTLTTLGWSLLYLVSLFVLATFFRYVYRHKIWEERAWFLWLCVVIPNIICLILKISLGRARPDLLFTKQLYGFYGFHTKSVFWSFPSGHTSTVMGFVFGLSILFPQCGYAFILSGALVVFSRIMLTYHYLSDVLAASYLALVEVGLLSYFLRRKGYLKGCRL